MELYIFDRELTFIGIIDNFISLRWVRKYYKIGEFELQCALTPDSLALLRRENIIYKKGDNEAGYIETRNLKQDAEGKEILVIKGKFLTGYLNRRIGWGTEIFNSTAEIAMRTLLSHNCISPVNTDRIINGLILGGINGFIGNVDYQTSYKNLSDEIENLSNISNLGYRIDLDIINKKLIFQIYQGLDRSANQEINPKTVFSKEFENILEHEYTDSLHNYKNLVLIGGIGEGSQRKLVTVGISNGLDRFEVFADQKSLSNEVDGLVMSDVEYTNLLIGKGNETLAETKEIITFDSRLNLKANLKYGIDFDLGDIITITSKKWNMTLDSRITEIEEVYEQNGLNINVVFGNNIPTLIDKIKSMSKQQSSSGGAGNIPLLTIDGGTF